MIWSVASMAPQLGSIDGRGCDYAATAVRGRSGAAAPQLQPLHNIARFRLLPPLQASPGMAPLAARGVVRG